MQENDVRRVEEFAALLVVVALVLVDPHQFQIRARSDPVKDLKACGPCLSVDVYFGLAHSGILLIIYLCIQRIAHFDYV